MVRKRFIAPDLDARASRTGRAARLERWLRPGEGSDGAS
jgi:hypothetical protein